MPSILSEATGRSKKEARGGDKKETRTTRGYKATGATTTAAGVTEAERRTEKVKWISTTATTGAVKTPTATTWIDEEKRDAAESWITATRITTEVTTEETWESSMK